MFFSQRKILRVVTVFLIFLGLFIWNFWIWKGTATIESNAVPFTVTLKTPKTIQGTTFECSASPCSMKVDPRDYEMTVSSESHFPETGSLSVSWMKESRYRVTLKQIPVLMILSEKPETWKDIPIVGADDHEFYLSPEGKIYKVEGENDIFLADVALAEREHVTLLPNEDNTLLYVMNKTDLYQVDIPGKRKYKIFYAPDGEEFSELRVFPGDILFIRSEIADVSRNIFYFPATRSVFPLEDPVTAGLICQLPEENTSFLYFTNNDEIWSLMSVNTETKTTEYIAEHVFPSPPVSVFCENQSSIILKTETGEYDRISF